MLVSSGCKVRDKDENLKVRASIAGGGCEALGLHGDREDCLIPSELLRPCCNFTFFRPLVLL